MCVCVCVCVYNIQAEDLDRRRAVEYGLELDHVQVVTSLTNRGSKLEGEWLRDQLVHAVESCNVCLARRIIPLLSDPLFLPNCRSDIPHPLLPYTFTIRGFVTSHLRDLAIISRLYFVHY